MVYKPFSHKKDRKLKKRWKLGKSKTYNNSITVYWYASKAPEGMLFI